MGKQQEWAHGPREQDPHGRQRGGKTRSDKASGAWVSRFANQAARAEWQKDARATNDTFPGKR